MPELCPKCNGQGIVSTPPWLDGDVHFYVDNVSGGYTCKVCGGIGYI
jgi:DnaJ-class molecular chaperone